MTAGDTKEGPEDDNAISSLAEMRRNEGWRESMSAGEKDGFFFVPIESYETARAPATFPG